MLRKLFHRLRASLRRGKIESEPERELRTYLEMETLALTRVIKYLLFNVSPIDATTFASITFPLVIVALLASYTPARRATKVDTLIALRDE